MKEEFSPEAEVKEGVKSILFTLAAQFSRNKNSEFSKQYEQFVPSLTTTAAELPEKLLRFLLSLEAEHPVVKLLRVVNQAIIAPVVSQLKTGLGKELPFNSVKGGWKVIINFSKSGLLVVHERAEQSLPGSTEWKFTWSISFMLDKDANLLTTLVNMIHLDVEKVGEKKERKEIKQRIESTFHNRSSLILTQSPNKGKK